MPMSSETEWREYICDGFRVHKLLAILFPQAAAFLSLFWVPFKQHLGWLLKILNSYLLLKCLMESFLKGFVFSGGQNLINQHLERCFNKKVLDLSDSSVLSPFFCGRWKEVSKRDYEWPPKLLSLWLACLCCGSQVLPRNYIVKKCAIIVSSWHRHKMVTQVVQWSVGIVICST